MPTPRPTIAAVGGAQSGTSTTRARSPPSARPVPRPNTAVISGNPIATADPKVNNKMTAAAMSPRPSEPKGGVSRAPRPARRPRPGEGVRGREDRLDQGRGLGRSEVAVPLVERDVGVGGLPVLGDLRGALLGERAGHAHDVVAVGNVGEDLRRLRPHLRDDAGVGVDHDLHGVARLLREALLEGVSGGLGLQSGCR